MHKGFFLPATLANKIVGVIKKSFQERRLNIGLFFDKYVLWWETKEGELKCSPEVQISILRNPNAKTLIGNPNIQGKKFKDKITENVRLSIPLTFLPKDKNKDYYKIYENKMKHLLNTLKNMGFYVEYLPSESSGLLLNWRLLINFGAASVYETSLLFHRNYSIPYIPGSAVKGVTRYWAILKFSGKLRKNAKDIDKTLSEGEDLGQEIDGVSFQDLIGIFGTQNEKGKVIFFDALPIIEQEMDFVVLDIMNVHYKPYYERGETPGDWYSPSPIFFLAVEKGTKFRFSLASKEKELVEKTKKLLEEALKYAGIGAKTSAGYGYFEV